MRILELDCRAGRGPITEWGSLKEDTVNAGLLGSGNPAAVRVFDRVGWR